MTISTNLSDMLQLAKYECDMLTALAYQRFGLDDLDEQVHLYGELPFTIAVQINVIYNLEFGMVQDRFLSSGCADLVIRNNTARGIAAAEKLGKIDPAILSGEKRSSFSPLLTPATRPTA